MPTFKQIIVLGNCQARPVATYLNEMTGGVSQYTPLIAHLSNSEQEADDFRILDAADLILTQPIEDTFKASHLATSLLKMRYPNNVITWPNLFFIGQTPDIISLRDELGKVINGPLESYQSAGVVNCWQNGMNADQAIEFLRNELPFPADVLKKAIVLSWENLSTRESQLDVRITDFIESRIERERLFFTFNHPSSRLLIEISERLCRVCDVPVIKPLISEFFEEPLGRLTAPTTKCLADLLGFKFPYTDACKGIEIKFEKKFIVNGNRKIYSFNDFVHSTYMALDHQLKKDQPVSSTPFFAGLQ